MIRKNDIFICKISDFATVAGVHSTGTEQRPVLSHWFAILTI